MSDRAESSKDFGQCTAQDDGVQCGKRVTGKGLKVCWGHYARQRRHSKKTGPVNEYGSDAELVSGPRLAPKVVRKLRLAAKHDGISLFELQNRLTQDWFRRLEVTEQPWLCGEPKALITNPTKQYMLNPQIRVFPGDLSKGSLYLKKTGRSWYWLIVHIMEDWYYHWYDRPGAVKAPPAEEASEKGHDPRPRRGY